MRLEYLAPLVALAASCVPKLEVPPGARVGCRTDADCPEGFQCSTDIQR